MKNKKYFTKMKMFTILLFVMAFVGVCVQQSCATKSIELIIDGKDVTEAVSPVIKNGRSLIPIRAITEKMDGKVDWNHEDKTVTINKDGNFVTLRVDSRLVSYGESNPTYGLSDVSPVILKDNKNEDRTYVPLRLVSNALNVGIHWDGDNKSIQVNSKETSSIRKMFEMEIIAPATGGIVEGKASLKVNLGDIDKAAKEIKYLLLDPASAEGFIIARGESLTEEFTYSPSIEDGGEKVLAAILYNKDGQFIAGDVVGVNIKVNPKVAIKGIKEGEEFADSVTFEPDLNFSPEYVKYQIKNNATGKETVTEKRDPYGSYTFTRMVHEAGEYEIKVTAYDENDKGYQGQGVNIKMSPKHRLSLVGVRSNMTISAPVSLGASRNFNVLETHFVLRDKDTGNEENLRTQPYGNYSWFPGVEYKGNKELLVRVIDTRGVVHQSKPVSVNLSGKPQLLINKIGPKQVITSSIKEVSCKSNIAVDSVEYVLENPKTGSRKSLKTLDNCESSFTFSPAAEDEGDRIFRAIATYGGKTVKSEDIPIRIYLGKTYGPTPIIEKSKFLGFASELAKESYQTTSMSAAFQTAQAILETGWGQSVPTDKYTGKLSNNLFGIKGRTAAGSVISNTWEEYNGVVYRIDAEFRAYNEIKDSWNDHKDFLLIGHDRYAKFREVMHDSTKGAWAIRRAGYATDSQYPVKLMNIIKQYDLKKLDKVKI